MPAETNIPTARAIDYLYNRLKVQAMDLTHSQYAVPLLDSISQQPIFRSTSLDEEPLVPSRPVIMSMLGKLKAAGVLMVIREGHGTQVQALALALAELVNLCEGESGGVSATGKIQQEEGLPHEHRCVLTSNSDKGRNLESASKLPSLRIKKINEVGLFDSLRT